MIKQYTERKIAQKIFPKVTDIGVCELKNPEYILKKIKYYLAKLKILIQLNITKKSRKNI